MSDMSALEEAQSFKRVLENTILSELKRFTDTSGLIVEGINVLHMNVTTFADKNPKVIYRVELEIKV